MLEKLDIRNLSPHLFWDVDAATISFDQHAEFVVGRVLDYGLMADWKILSKSIGVEQIAKIAMNIRELDPKSLSFISALSKIPKEKFRCFTTQQSMPQHWNF
ncbi:MAG: hypothetical protein K9H16_15585 [Bacteroidales bacterium]|nr:hypothetical protein [Bacteroidales bacterium]